MRDRRAFEELVAARGTALLRFALMLCGDPDRAQDLVQSVLAKAYRKWGRVARAGQPEAYLKAMLVNEHLGWWRRRSNRELPIPDTVPAPDPAARDDAADHASRDAAWALLARLPRQQRAVLVLRYYEDLGDDEIGRVLGCTPSAVRSYASRALAALRTLAPTLDTELLP